MALRFRCVECRSMSGFGQPAEGRGEVLRLQADPNETHEVCFYCDQCGAANTVSITPDMLPSIIARLSSDDPQIQKAIDDAKRGNYGSAIEQARRRFKF